MIPFFSPDGRTLAINHSFNAMSICDVDTGQKTIDLFKAEESPLAVEFAPDGKCLACRFPKCVRVWDIASGRELATYSNKDEISQLTFSSEGKLLALDKNLVLWDVIENKIIKELALQGEQRMSGFSNSVLLLAKGDIFKVWDLPTAKSVELRGISNPFKGALFWPVVVVKKTSDRRSLILFQTSFVGPPHPIYVFDLIKGTKSEIASKEWVNITTDGIAPDGRTVALDCDSPEREADSLWSWLTNLFGQTKASPVKSLALRAFPSSQEIIFLKGCFSPVFSPDGKTLAVHSLDGSWQLWDLPIRKPIGKILGLAGLAAVATLLAFNSLGWLRKGRDRILHTGAS